MDRSLRKGFLKIRVIDNENELSYNVLCFGFMFLLYIGSLLFFSLFIPYQNILAGLIKFKYWLSKRS